MVTANLRVSDQHIRAPKGLKELSPTADFSVAVITVCFQGLIFDALQLFVAIQ